MSDKAFENKKSTQAEILKELGIKKFSELKIKPAINRVIIYPLPAEKDYVTSSGLLAVSSLKNNLHRGVILAHKPGKDSQAFTLGDVAYYSPSAGFYVTYDNRAKVIFIYELDIQATI